MQDKSSNFKDYGKKPSPEDCKKYMNEMAKMLVDDHVSLIRRIEKNRKLLNVLIVLNLLLLAFSIGRFKANEKMEEIRTAPLRIVEVQK